MGLGKVQSYQWFASRQQEVLSITMLLDLAFSIYEHKEVDCPLLYVQGTGMSVWTVVGICDTMGVYKSTSVLGVDREITSE